MSEEKRSRRDGAPPTLEGWCQGVRPTVVPTSPPASSAASGQGMNLRLLRRACPKLGRRSGTSAGPESPTERSALGQPGALDSAQPAPGPPPHAPQGGRPRAPGKHSTTSRTTAPPQYLSHVPGLSVRMPVSAPDRSPLSPCAHADPPKPVWSRRLGSAPARRVCGCSPRPALPHGARPGSYRRRGDSPFATGPPAQGPRLRAVRLRRRRIGAGPRSLTRHQHQLCAA